MRARAIPAPLWPAARAAVQLKCRLALQGYELSASFVHTLARHAIAGDLRRPAWVDVALGAIGGFSVGALCGVAALYRLAGVL